MTKMRLPRFLCWPAALLAAFTTTVQADAAAKGGDDEFTCPKS